MHDTWVSVFTFYLRALGGSDRVAEGFKLQIADNGWCAHDDPPHYLHDGIYSASSIHCAWVTGRAGLACFPALICSKHVPRVLLFGR